MTPDQLAGVAQLLRQDPASHAAFGPLWWSVKRMLKDAYGPDPKVLYALTGHADDPETRARVEAVYPTPEAQLRAALQHYAQKCAWGERYENHSYMPDDEAHYSLFDPDMDAATQPA